MKLFASLNRLTFPTLMTVLLLLCGFMLMKPVFAEPPDKDILQAIKGNIYFDTGESLVLDKLELYKPSDEWRLYGTYSAPNKAAVPVYCSWGDAIYVRTAIGSYFCRAETQMIVFHYIAAGVFEVVDAYVPFKAFGEKSYGYVGFGSPLLETAWLDPNGLVFLPSVMYGEDRYTAYLQSIGDNNFKLISAVKQ